MTTRPETLLAYWKAGIEERLTNALFDNDDNNLSIDDIYNDLVEEEKHFTETFIDEDELSQEYFDELLKKFDEDDDLTDIEALLFRYGTLMLYIKKEWIQGKIQEILNRLKDRNNL